MALYTRIEDQERLIRRLRSNQQDPLDLIQGLVGT